MRICKVQVWSLLAAALALSSLTFAQTATVAASSGSSPDLSGVWNVKKTADTAYLGWTFSKDVPPMTAWAEERFKLTRPSFGPRAMADSNDPVNPTTLGTAGCFPPGMPRLYLQPFPMEIIQLPGRVLEFFEYSHFVRQIFTDGRKHNTDAGPTWLGDAIGNWEGDTLVVDTIGFNDKTWLDRAGHPHSTDLHLTERLRRVDQNTLTIDVKIEDPKAYTKPWGGRITLGAHPKWNIMEMDCEDNANYDQVLKKEAAPSPKK